jgi:hypothetical protein
MKQIIPLFICCLILSACNQIAPKPQKIYYPSQDLSLENGSMKHNMIKEGGFFTDPKYDGWILTGDVRNNGEVIYKNIAILIQYQDKDGHPLTSENFVLHKTIAPGTTADVNVKLYPPNEMHEYTYTVTNAAVVHTDGSQQ